MLVATVPVSVEAVAVAAAASVAAKVVAPFRVLLLPLSRRTLRHRSL
jgi:hypothetical protein